MKGKCVLCDVTIRAHANSFKRHAETRKHSDAVKAKFSTPPVIHGRVRGPTSREREERKIFEIKIALYIVLNSSIRAVDPLFEILQDCVGVNLICMHCTKLKQLVKTMIGPAFRDQLLKEVSDSFFSLIVDESTDISTTQFVGFVVR